MLFSIPLKWSSFPVCNKNYFMIIYSLLHKIVISFFFFTTEKPKIIVQRRIQVIPVFLRSHWHRPEYLVEESFEDGSSLHWKRPGYSNSFLQDDWKKDRKFKKWQTFMMLLLLTAVTATLFKWFIVRVVIQWCKYHRYFYSIFYVFTEPCLLVIMLINVNYMYYK